MRFSLRWAGVTAVVALLSLMPARAESHRATRLGNPATRFAAPLFTPEDLRARFRDPKLRPDFVSVLKQWGWEGNVADMFAAAETAELADIKIPIGFEMPFMSSREGGRAICLRNVTWAGQEPAPAYAFNFTSNGRRYRCVTPKACSNFYVEDFGPEPMYGLKLDCEVPAREMAGRKIHVCLNLSNTGNIAEPKALVTLPVPVHASVVEGEGYVLTNNTLVWQADNLAAGAAQQFCADFRTKQPGALKFAATAASLQAQPAQSACETTVTGISALLLETADDPDPVSVGETTTYTVRVTNQGTADDTNVKVVVEFPEELEPVSASDEGVINGRTVTFPVFPRLAPKQAFKYTIVAKGAKAGDVRVKFIRTSDDIPAPTSAEESTRTL